MFLVTKHFYVVGDRFSGWFFRQPLSLIKYEETKETQFSMELIQLNFVGIRLKNFQQVQNPSFYNIHPFPIRFPSRRMMISPRIIN